MNSLRATLTRGIVTHNPAWTLLLGLCPLLAVSSSVVNALGLAAASAFVVIASNGLIASVRHLIPEFARLPCFVLIIATFTTIVTQTLEAFAYELYLSIALFVQIIVTNCMILGRAEAFASRQPVGRALLDAIGTALGFAIALLALGAVREVIGSGTLFAGAARLFGPEAQTWQLTLVDSGIAQNGIVPLAHYPPGAFIIAGLLLAAGIAVRNRILRKPDSNPTRLDTHTP